MRGNEELTELLTRLESGHALPSLSPVALKLVELAADEASSAADLVSLIEKDPSLAVRLLKLANSAFFRATYPANTLNQAVVRVGFPRLRMMALTVSLRNTFPMGKVGPLNYEEFWRISIYRAIIAKSLAERLKGCNPDEAFVAALILEAGLLIFFDLMIRDKDEEVSLDLDSLDDLLSWQTERYGVNHRQIGEAALKFWRFPSSIIACQKMYGEESKIREAPLIARICDSARLFAEMLFRQSWEFHSLFDEAENTMGIGQQEMNEILIETFDQVEEIADILAVELTKERDLLEIMEKANRALSQISDKIAASLEKPSQRLPSFESLDRADEIISHTLQAVAHEIRNPLMAVGGFARRLALTFDPSTDGGKYLQMILKETSRLEETLSSMVRERPNLA